MLRPASRPTCSTLPIAALQSDSPSLDLAKLFKTQFLNPERFQQLLLIKLVPKKFNRGGSPSKDTSADECRRFLLPPRRDIVVDVGSKSVIEK